MDTARRREIEAAIKVSEGMMENFNAKLIEYGNYSYAFSHAEIVDGPQLGGQDGNPRPSEVH